MTLWICCHLWWQLGLQWSCFILCWTCPVSLLHWSCSTGEVHTLKQNCIQMTELSIIHSSNYISMYSSPSHWVSVYVCVEGQRVYPSLTPADAASCHWMLFETPHSEDFSSSCFVGKQAQVNTVRWIDELHLSIPFIQSIEFVSENHFAVLYLPTGDTIDRLSTLHEQLAEAASWPRVVQCAQTVPVLLHIFFNTVVTVKRLKCSLQIHYNYNCLKAGCFSFCDIHDLSWMSISF